MDYITNPLSSKQIVDVPILKPDCADYCGTDLTSILQWLVNQPCKYNWKNFDISCLDSTIQTCDKDLDTILKAIVDNICTLNLTSGSTESTGCGCDSDQVPISLERGWEDFAAQNVATAYRVGNVVHLKGRISGGSFLATIANIPDPNFRPSYIRRVPFAHTFNLGLGTSIPFLEIDTTGDINVVWSGLAPSSSTPGDMWFDGVSFIIN